MCMCVYRCSFGPVSVWSFCTYSRHSGGDSQTDADLREAAGAIVDKFFGEEGYDSSDEEEDDDNSGGGKGGWARNSTQPGDQPFAPLGRGAHLTRPAWMNP